MILPWADQSLLGSADRVEVRLRVLVDQQGHVERSQIERSSGDPQIDARAVAAARRLRYRPGRQDGLPVEAWRSQVLAVRRD